MICPCDVVVKPTQSLTCTPWHPSGARQYPESSSQSSIRALEPRKSQYFPLYHLTTTQLVLAYGFNFSRVYGPLGAGFIEAHHLVPLSQLKGQIISLDPSKDFAVLCSNCHSMIHKFEKPHDVQAFKTLLRTKTAG